MRCARPPAAPARPLTRPSNPSLFPPSPRDWDILLTAETHNFPCAVAPYPGAETGAGGRIRDTHATGTGSLMGVSTAGYCVGALRLSGAPAPWEDAGFEYPPNLAPPLQILIDASNGARRVGEGAGAGAARGWGGAGGPVATLLRTTCPPLPTPPKYSSFSDYGNKFGEPLVTGYTRSYGARAPDGARREWVKPIMFSGGLGQIDHAHLDKAPPELGMLVVKIGGPAYRIGMGGGAASSVPSGGADRADLDFDAVQRGDAEMAQKLWRVVRACAEAGAGNFIQQIHDQGAGGNCNVVKEIIYPLGARIDLRNIALGDESMSVLEIWGAEYQARGMGGGGGGQVGGRGRRRAGGRVAARRAPPRSPPPRRPPSTPASLRPLPIHPNRLSFPRKTTACSSAPRTGSAWPPSASASAA